MPFSHHISSVTSHLLPLLTHLVLYTLQYFASLGLLVSSCAVFYSRTHFVSAHTTFFLISKSPLPHIYTILLLLLKLLHPRSLSTVCVPLLWTAFLNVFFSVIQFYPCRCEVTRASFGFRSASLEGIIFFVYWLTQIWAFVLSKSFLLPPHLPTLHSLPHRSLSLAAIPQGHH